MIGRNFEVQSIVVHLDYDSDKIKTKIIHIYGLDGIGKTAIVLHAARYAFERRFFPQGAFYVDLANCSY